MNGDSFREMVRAFAKCGLRISSDGVVHDSEGEYCRMGRTGVATASGETVAYASVVSMSYNEMYGMLVLFMGEGDEKVVRRGRLAPQDGPAGPGGSMEMPSCTSELRDAFRVVYPRMGEQAWYDELTEREMVDMAMFGRPKEGVRPMSDTIRCIYHDDIERRLAAAGYVGRRLPSLVVRDEAFNVAISDNRRNLFREWAESHEWDGTPRLRTLFRDWFGGTAPALRGADGLPTEDEAQYLGDVAEAWILGAVRRMYAETKHEVVPVLIGSQGVGKGTALKFLAGQDQWYRDTTVDFKDPQKFLDSVRGSVIVELGEGIQLNTDDVGTLKAFISQSSDHMRKAYAHYDESYPRHFILASSSNVDTLFRDPTGARRFFPVYCDPEVQHASGKVIPTNGRPPRLQYEVEQIWAEALVLYRDHHRWYIRDKHTIELSQQMQAYCSEEMASDIIAEYLDNPMNGYTALGSRISRTSILEEVFNLQGYAYIPEECDRAWKQWISDPVGWRRVDGVKKLRGRTARVYERVCGPEDVPRRSTFAMVDADTWMAEAADCTEEGRLRTLIDEHSDGDRLLTDGLSDRDILELLEAGMIYDVGRSQTHHDYRLAEEK